jgi:hypothetical protein
MKPELRDKIIAYNNLNEERKRKAEDLDAIISQITHVAPSLLRLMLPDKAIAVLKKYGISFD